MRASQRPSAGGATAVEDYGMGTYAVAFPAGGPGWSSPAVTITAGSASASVPAGRVSC